jgi:hypothetical protein
MMSAAGEGEAFAGAAGGEEPGDTEAGLPGQVLAVARLAEPEFVVEISGKENNPDSSRGASSSGGNLVTARPCVGQQLPGHGRVG